MNKKQTQQRVYRANRQANLILGKLEDKQAKQVALVELAIMSFNMRVSEIWEEYNKIEKSKTVMKSIKNIVNEMNKQLQSGE